MPKKIKKKVTKAKKIISSNKRNNSCSCSLKQNKKIFWITTGIIFLILISVITYGLLKTRGAGSIFSQTDWSGLASTDIPDVTIPPNATDWNKYSSANNVNTTSGSVVLGSAADTWAPGGVLLSGTSGTLTAGFNNPKYNFTFIGTGSDMVAAWVDTHDNNKVYAKRFNASSYTPSSWEGPGPDPEEKGITVSGLSSYSSSNINVVKSDSESTIFFIISVWDQNLYAVKIDGDGGGVWGANPLTSAPSSGPYGAVSDGADGAIVTWSQGPNLYTQRIDSDGSIHTGWPSSGVLVASDFVNNANIISDGNHGAIFSWKASGNLLRVQRVDSSGSNSGWGPGGIGLDISSGSVSDITNIISDGAGGAVVAWEKNLGGGNKDIYSQRVNSSGNAIWNSGSAVVLANTSDEENTPKLILADSSNIIAIWRRANISAGRAEIYGQKIALSDGSFPVPWDSGPKLLAYGGITNPTFDISPDNSGGFYLIWEDASGNVMKGIRADSTGALVSGWLANGIVLNTISSPISLVLKNKDTGDFTTYVWMNNNKIYAQRFSTTVGYAASGDLTSSIIDAGTSNNWDGNIFNWTAATPANTSVSFQTRTAINDPTNFSLGGMASASSSCTVANCGLDAPPNNVNDGDPDTFWVGDFTLAPLPQSISIDFGAVKNISVVTMKTPSDIGGSGHYSVPMNYDIQTWDGMGWVTQISVTGNHAFENASTFPTVSSSRVQIVVNAVDQTVGVDAAVISELEVHSGSGSWSSWADVVNSGDPISSPSGRYLQYKASLATTDSSVTPTLTQVSLGAPFVPQAPSTYTPTPSLSINNGDGNTANRNVTLTFGNITSDVKKIKIADNLQMSNLVALDYQSSIPWDLCRGSDQCPDGSYALYALLFNASDIQVGSQLSASINLLTQVKEEVPVLTLDEALAKIKELEQKIVDLLKENADLKDENAKLKAAPVPVPAPIAENIYTVQPLDNLTSIARKVYGTQYLYTRLVELNKDRYPSLLINPNLIQIGWQLIF